MNKFKFLYLVTILWGLVLTNEYLLGNSPVISQDQAKEISSNSGFKNLTDSIEFDAKSLGEKNINSIYKLIYNLILNAPSPFELDNKLKLFRFIKNKYPHDFNMFDDIRVLRFKNKLMITVMILFLYLYFRMRSWKGPLIVGGFFSCAFMNVLYWKGIADVLPYTLAIASYHFISLVFEDHRKIFWGKNVEFYGFSIKSSFIHSTIFALIICIFSFYYKWGISHDLGVFFNAFLTPSLFYFLFPWIFFLFIVHFLSVLTFGVYVTTDVICVVHFYKLPVFYKKNEIRKVEIKNGEMLIEFVNSKPVVRIGNVSDLNHLFTL